MAYTSFEDLEIWQRGTRLAVSIYNELSGCRDFSLRDQLQRSAVSIPSNIAEGSERDSNPDYIRFLRIAKGSAAELRTQLHIAEQIGILTAENAHSLRTEAKEITAMTQGLISYLLKS